VTTLKDLLEIKVVLNTPQVPVPRGWMSLREAVQNFGLPTADLPECITVNGGEWIQEVAPNEERGYRLYMEKVH